MDTPGRIHLLGKITKRNEYHLDNANNIVDGALLLCDPMSAAAVGRLRQSATRARDWLSTKIAIWRSENTWRDFSVQELENVRISVRS